MKTWTCGDCHTTYPMEVRYCQRPYSDYLSLRGGTIESAITQAVDRAIEPLIKAATDHVRPRRPAVFGFSTRLAPLPGFAAAS